MRRAQGTQKRHRGKVSCVLRGNTVFQEPSEGDLLNLSWKRPVIFSNFKFLMNMLKCNKNEEKNTS